MKKIALILMALLILVGCGSKTDTGSKDEPVKLTVWYHPYVGADKKEQLVAVFDGMAETFKKDYPDAEVVFEEIPWANRETKITTALAGGAGPDIFYLIPDQLTQFANDGIITPIDEVLPDTDLSDFTSTSLASVTYKEKLYGLPILRESQTLFYNLDVLEAIGGDANDLPETWEEFQVLADKAKAAGYFARTYDGANTLNATLYPLIWQAGGEVVNDKDEISINNEKSVKAFELLNKWYTEGYISPESIAALDSVEPFLEGKVLASWNTGAMLAKMKENNVRYAIGSPLKGEVEATYGTTGTFVVASTSKNKEAAASLLVAMTNTENSREFNKLTGYIPARVSAQDIFAENPDMAKMAEFVEIARPGVIHAKARIFMPDLTANVQAMLEGSQTPQETADKAAEIIKTHIGG